jgi:hypothetical protein
VRDGATFYSLTYCPTDPTRDIHHFRKISITLNGRPDLKVVTISEKIGHKKNPRPL